MKPIVAYYRVSTQKRARSGKKGLGLGLEAQREALERFAQANGLQIVAEFTEIETGKGADALELRPPGKCSQHGPETQMLDRGREARQAFQGCPLHQRAHGASHPVHCRGARC